MKFSKANGTYSHYKTKLGAARNYCPHCGGYFRADHGQPCQARLGIEKHLDNARKSLEPSQEGLGNVQRRAGRPSAASRSLDLLPDEGYPTPDEEGLPEEVLE